MKEWPDRNAEGKLICDRCGQVMGGFTMSFFNTEYICFECDEKERAHPDYAKAKAAELASIKPGEPNYFPGIGKPADL